MFSDPQHPIRGDLKAWGVWKGDRGPLWTTDPAIVTTTLNNDYLAAETTVIAMTPGETMESLWPSWKVECRKVSQEWFDKLPAVADF